MAITIDYNTFVIDHPQSELTLISGTLYKEETNSTRKKLKVIEASEEGIIFPNTHKHNTTVTLFGVTYARTIEIIAPYSITYSPDAQWSVRLDGSNNNIGDVEAGILNQNQVQVIPTNSAGLQDLSTLLAAAYQGHVVINTRSGQAGTSTPVGTFFKPSNNLPDSLVISHENGIVNFILGNSMTIIEDLEASGTVHNFIGSSPFNIVTLASIAKVAGTTFKNLTIQGELDGVNVIRECSLKTITDLSGFVEKCAFTSTATMNGNVLIMDSYSNIEGAGYPTLIGVLGSTLEVRDWHGSIGVGGIQNLSHTIGGAGGRCVIDSTCTGGDIHIRGDWFEIVDNSGAGCTVYDERGDVWSITEKNESLAYSRKASDNAEQANLKII